MCIVLLHIYLIMIDQLVKDYCNQYNCSYSYLPISVLELIWDKIEESKKQTNNDCKQINNFDLFL
jgi:hypothetical protein